MALLLGEIVVEFVGIAATLGGIACLAYLLILCALERREMRLLTESRVREWAAQRRQEQEPGRPRSETPERSLTSTVQTQV